MLFSKADLKRLIIPLLLEQLLAVTIGMMDTVMVASCGEAAISGVSLVDSINVLLINVFSALATGGAVVASQYLGKQERHNAGAVAKQLFYVTLACALVIMALCLAFHKGLLGALFGSIEADVMRNAQIYFLISALSYPFLAMYNASAALLRSMGNAKASLYASIITNVVNIAGNALLIYGFNMGVAGAAIATLISRAMGAIMTQLMLRKPDCVIPYPVLHRFEWRGDMVKKILSIGVPNGLENGMFQLGKLLLLRMVSTFGTVSIAANAVGNTMASVQILPGMAIGLAMTTVVGQCVGAKAYDQARYYVRRMMILSYLCIGVLNVAILLLSGLIVIPFNLSAETAELAKHIIILHGAGSIFFWPLAFVLPNALRAAGDARFTMIVSSISMAVFRIALGYFMGMTLHMGVLGVWYAMQIDWLCRITCFVLRYRSGKWESKRLV